MRCSLQKPSITCRYVNTSCFICIGGMAVATVLIIVITPLMYHFFINERYHAAIRAIIIFYVSGILCGLFLISFLFPVVQLSKRKIFLFSLCCIAVSMICNYFFIRQGKISVQHTEWLPVFIVLVLTLLFTKEYWQQFYFTGEMPVLISAAKFKFSLPLMKEVVYKLLDTVTSIRGASQNHQRFFSKAAYAIGIFRQIMNHEILLS